MPRYCGPPSCAGYPSQARPPCSHVRCPRLWHHAWPALLRQLRYGALLQCRVQPPELAGAQGGVPAPASQEGLILNRELTVNKICALEMPPQHFRCLIIILALCALCVFLPVPPCPAAGRQQPRSKHWATDGWGATKPHSARAALLPCSRHERHKRSPPIPSCLPGVQ